MPEQDPLWGPFTDRRSRSAYLWDCFWRHADHIRQLMPELKPRQWERIRWAALASVVRFIETEEPTLGLKEAEADCERALFFALQFKDKTCDCEELNCGCEPVTDGELARLDVVDAVEFAILEHHQDILEDDLLRDARIVDGRRRVSYGSWQWVLKKTVRIVIETCRKVLELNANDPDVDVLRLRLAEKAPWQLTETWRSITHDSRLGLPDSGDIDLEPGPLGVDEHVDAEVRTIAKDILAILPAQGGPFNVWEYLNAEIDREQAELDKANAAANALVEKISSMAGTSPEPQPVREEAGEPGTSDQAVTSEAVWRIPRESFDAFVEKVRTIRRVSKSDIDFAAGYSDRSTREDLEAGRGNSRSHAKYTRVLQMEPSKFVAELDALNNSAKSRIVPQNPA